MLFLAVVNIGILAAIGVRPELIALAHVHLACCALFGRLVLRRFWWAELAGPDRRPVRWIVAALIGGIAYATLLGFLLHATSDPTALGVAIWLLSGFGLLAGGRSWLLDRGPIGTERRGRKLAWIGRAIRFAPLESLLALVVATCTIHGFNNTPNPALSRSSPGYAASETDRPNWGYQGDKGAHLVILPDQLMSEGLPGERIGHRGVQLSILPVVLHRMNYETRAFVDTFKALGFYFWLALLLLVRETGREIYGLHELESNALVVSAVFLGAINFPLFELRMSTYAGFMKPTLSAFHNTTQLLSLIVGGAGFHLLLAAIKDRPKLMSLASLMIGASFFYKPSFFTLVAPFVVLSAIVWIRSFERFELMSMFGLCALPILWMIYVRLSGGSSEPLDPAFSPFLLYFRRAAWRFPALITGSPILFGLAIVLCSFLFAILVCLPQIGRLRAVRLTRKELLFALPLVVFLAGTTISLVLVENNPRQSYGNFSWLGHTAYFLALPVFFRFFSELKSTIYRGVCLVVLIAHLAAGIQHLVYFTREEKIVESGQSWSQEAFGHAGASAEGEPIAYLSGDSGGSTRSARRGAQASIAGGRSGA